MIVLKDFVSLGVITFLSLVVPTPAPTVESDGPELEEYNDLNNNNCWKTLPFTDIGHFIDLITNRYIQLNPSFDEGQNVIRIFKYANPKQIPFLFVACDLTDRATTTSVGFFLAITHIIGDGNRICNNVFDIKSLSPDIKTVIQHMFDFINTVNTNDSVAWYLSANVLGDEKEYNVQGNTDEPDFLKKVILETRKTKILKELCTKSKLEILQFKILSFTKEIKQKDTLTYLIGEIETDDEETPPYFVLVYNHSKVDVKISNLGFTTATFQYFTIGALKEFCKGRKTRYGRVTFVQQFSQKSQTLFDDRCDVNLMRQAAPLVASNVQNRFAVKNILLAKYTTLKTCLSRFSIVNLHQKEGVKKSAVFFYVKIHSGLQGVVKFRSSKRWFTSEEAQDAILHKLDNFVILT